MIASRVLSHALVLATMIGAYGCAGTDTQADDDDGSASDTSSSGASTGSSTGPSVCGDLCYDHQSDLSSSGGCGDPESLSFEALTSAGDCELRYRMCSDGSNYDLACTGSPGNWSCECRLNGPVSGMFTSPTLCEWNNAQSATQEANAGCGWNLQ